MNQKSEGGARCGFEPAERRLLELFQHLFLSQFLPGQVNFSDLAILCNRPVNKIVSVLI